MMQRTPMTMAAAYRRRFVERFGLVGHGGLRAVPELAVVAELTGAEIGEAIGHRGKGEKIEAVVRGVAALGEDFLVTASYEQARDALLEIPHVGPFSAAAILLRGLGRMDELPMMPQFEEQARAVYGRVDLDEIRRRYGRSIGYWSFYLMVADRAGERRTRAA
jgi:DNA-3-methyladenine glycosylase II